MQRLEETKHTIEGGSLGGLIRACVEFGRNNSDWWPHGQCEKVSTPQGSRWRQRWVRNSKESS